MTKSVSEININKYPLLVSSFNICPLFVRAHKLIKDIRRNDVLFIDQFDEVCFKENLQTITLSDKGAVEYVKLKKLDEKAKLFKTHQETHNVILSGATEAMFPDIIRAHNLTDARFYIEENTLPPGIPLCEVVLPAMFAYKGNICILTPIKPNMQMLTEKNVLALETKSIKFCINNPASMRLPKGFNPIVVAPPKILPLPKPELLAIAPAITSKPVTIPSEATIISNTEKNISFKKDRLKILKMEYQKLENLPITKANEDKITFCNRNIKLLEKEIADLEKDIVQRVSVEVKKISPQLIAPVSLLSSPVIEEKKQESKEIVNKIEEKAPEEVKQTTNLSLMKQISDLQLQLKDSTFLKDKEIIFLNAKLVDMQRDNDSILDSLKRCQAGLKDSSIEQSNLRQDYNKLQNQMKTQCLFLNTFIVRFF